MLLDVGDGGLANVLDVQSLFFIKENWICAMTRHHAEPNINIPLTRNPSFDYDVRQWSHPFMKPLHFLWVKWNNKMRGQFECDVASFCFCFDFVPSHARCNCCSIVSNFFTFPSCAKKKKTKKNTGGWMQNEY